MGQGGGSRSLRDRTRVNPGGANMSLSLDLPQQNTWHKSEETHWGSGGMSWGSGIKVPLLQGEFGPSAC